MPHCSHHVRIPPIDPRLERALRRIVLIGAAAGAAGAGRARQQRLARLRCRCGCWRCRWRAGGRCTGSACRAGRSRRRASAAGGAAAPGAPPRRPRRDASGAARRPECVGRPARVTFGRRGTMACASLRPSGRSRACRSRRTPCLPPASPSQPAGRCRRAAIPTRGPMSEQATASTGSRSLSWLEDVNGDKPLDWVRAAERHDRGRTRQRRRRSRSSKPTSARSSIPTPRSPASRRSATYYYNFWKDAQHERGLWRRTTLDEYRKPQPQWETVIDLDALNAAERRELGLARRRLPQARVPALPGRAVARRRRCRRHPRVRPRHEAVGEGRLLPPRSQGRRWAGSTRTPSTSTPTSAPARMTTSGLPAHRQAVEARHAAGAAPRWCTKASRATCTSPPTTTTRRASSATSSAARIAFYNDELYLRGSDGKLAKVDAPEFGATSRVHARVAAAASCAIRATAGGKTYPAGCAARDATSTTSWPASATFDRAVRADRHAPRSPAITWTQQPPGAQRARRRQEPAAAC